jgi:hypothetical protein
LNDGISAPLFGSKPQVYQEADRPAVMADQVAHQYIGYVIVEDGHRYTNS